MYFLWATWSYHVCGSMVHKVRMILKKNLYQWPRKLASPVKNSGWKTTFLLGWPFLGGHVSFLGTTLCHLAPDSLFRPLFHKAVWNIETMNMSNWTERVALGRTRFAIRKKKLLGLKSLEEHHAKELITSIMTGQQTPPDEPPPEIRPF